MNHREAKPQEGDDMHAIPAKRVARGLAWHASGVDEPVAVGIRLKPAAAIARQYGRSFEGFAETGAATAKAAASQQATVRQRISIGIRLRQYAAPQLAGAASATSRLSPLSSGADMVPTWFSSRADNVFIGC
jgi:hypothetical protein